MARRIRIKEPTNTDILSKYTEAQNYWAQYHYQADQDYKTYKDKQEAQVPDGYNVVRLGTANSIISTAADHITGDSPRIKVPEANDSESALARSERLEKGLQAALWRFQSVLTENPIRTLVINGLWSGMMVAKGPLFLSEEWGDIPIESDYEDKDEYTRDSEDYETNKKVSWPFYWRAEDPRYVFPDPGTVGRKWVIVSYARTVGSVKAQWPSWDGRTPGMSKQSEPLPDTAEVQWVEYWDEYFKCYLLAARPMQVTAAPKANYAELLGAFKRSRSITDMEVLGKVYRHKYKKPPFQIRSSGYGSDSGQPHERFESIITRARPLLNQEIVIHSQLDAIMRRTAWPIVLTTLNSGFDSLEPGTVKEMDEKALQLTKSFTELQPQIPQMLMAEADYISQQIQEATFPNVVQGIKAKGIASGYGQNSLVAQAKVKYGAAVVNLSWLLSDAMVDFARCVQYVVDEPVYLWGKTKWGMADAVLKPSDINDLRHVEVTVNPKIPADRANEIEIGGVLVDRGAIDMDTYVQDFVGYENPGEMRKRVLRDRALQSPEILRVMGLWAALKGGYIDKVMEMAVEIGMDPGQLLAILGFGNPSQQAAAPNQGAGAPSQVAAARQGGTATMFGGNLKAQPVPGSPSDVRNQTVPGVPIGG